MLTSREARQRTALLRGSIQFIREFREYRVTLQEWTRDECKDKAYFTDDLEDALHTLAAMRWGADK